MRLDYQKARDTWKEQAIVNIKAIIDAALPDEDLYYEPDCSHRRLLSHRDECAACGAIPGWFARVET